MEKDKRLPKQFGDFAEGFVMYILGKYKNMRMALVDHVGADIIATNNNSNDVLAISVKGRNFPVGESKEYRFCENDVEKLIDFAKSFNMKPTIAFVFVDDMEKCEKIRLFVLKLDTLKKLAQDEKIKYIKISNANGGGYLFNYKGPRNNYLDMIKQRSDIDYTELKISDIKESLNI